MAKLNPAPRRPQKRSEFSVAETLIILPSAVTMMADKRASRIKPWIPWYRPTPAPRVAPTTPTQGQEPISAEVKIAFKNRHC